MAVSGLEAEGFSLHLQALKIDGKAPELCTPDIMSAIFRQHLRSPSIWAIFPIQVMLHLLPSEFGWVLEAKGSCCSPCSMDRQEMSNSRARLLQ